MQHRNYNMFSFFVDPRMAEMLESTSGGSMSTSTLKWWCSTTDDCAQDPDVVFAIGLELMMLLLPLTISMNWLQKHV
jgi:hypothetical protein